MSIRHVMTLRLRAKDQSLAHNHAVHEPLLFTPLNCYVRSSNLAYSS